MLFLCKHMFASFIFLIIVVFTIYLSRTGLLEHSKPLLPWLTHFPLLFGKYIICFTVLSEDIVSSLCFVTISSAYKFFRYYNVSYNVLIIFKFFFHIMPTASYEWNQAPPEDRKKLTNFEFC